MPDPDEGLTAAGVITTGVDRSRVPDWAEPILADAIETIGDRARAVYLYGSVATGQARRGVGELDVIASGWIQTRCRFSTVS